MQLSVYTREVVFAAGTNNNRKSHHPHGALKRQIEDGTAKTFWLSGLSETTGLYNVRRRPSPIATAEINMYRRWSETFSSNPVFQKVYIIDYYLLHRLHSMCRLYHLYCLAPLSAAIYLIYGTDT